MHAIQYFVKTACHRSLSRMMNSQFYLLVALCLSCSVYAWSQDSKIIGGEEITIEEQPYTLQLQTRAGLFWSHSCGGVIIGPNTALTTGRCVISHDVKDVRFRSGNKNRGQGAIHNAQEVILHPNYTDIGYPENDLAIVRVTPPFEFSSTTQPVSLADAQPEDGANATVSGWGTTESGSGAPHAPVLQKADISIVGVDECRERYVIIDMNDSMICAEQAGGGKGFCGGDGGGPLTVGNKLVGLVSFGLECGGATFPGVYASTYNKVSWIQEQLVILSN